MDRAVVPGLDEGALEDTTEGADWDKMLDAVKAVAVVVERALFIASPCSSVRGLEITLLSDCCGDQVGSISRRFLAG